MGEIEGLFRLLELVLLAVLVRGAAVVPDKPAAQMAGVDEARFVCDSLDGMVGMKQSVGCKSEADSEAEFAEANAHRLPKDMVKAGSTQGAGGRGVGGGKAAPWALMDQVDRGHDSGQVAATRVRDSLSSG